MTSSSLKSCPSCGQRYDADVLFCPQDGTPLTNLRGVSRTSTEADLYIGLELAGQIRIKHLIGIGSMGRVYRAFQGGIERDVAVKVLHRELSGNQELVTRFHREAKIASRLAHPNLVSVLMAGSIPQKGDPRVGGEMYLVMEYLDGISLLSALAAAGADGVASALPLSRTLHIMMQVCEAVGEAHAQGIVHRDIKPENVMLVRRGDDPDFVKVLDFGIARLDWHDKSATQAGLIFGTAKYISPEGAEGKPVTPAADVYSIATVLYQCLAGRTPFEGDSPVQLLMQHSNTPPPELRDIPRSSYVPAPIADVVMRNLSKKPSDRASDARALGKELLVAARDSGLDPDEVFRGGLLVARRGAVKLPSKERTKSLDLSPEMAARIGGVAAPSAESTPLPTSTPPEPDADTQEASSDLSSPSSSDETPIVASPTEPERAVAAPVDDEVRSTQPRIDSLDDQASSTALQPLAESTIQGTEQSLSEPPPPPVRGRARMARIIAIGVCLAAVPLVAIVGGQKLGLISAGSSDAVTKTLDAARDAIRRQAWDQPPGDNVVELLDGARAKWPDDPRVTDLRREAAERLVTDALGHKYAGEIPKALHLARLAIALHPSLTAAQHLVLELQGKLPTAPNAPVGTSAPSVGVPTTSTSGGSPGGHP